MSYEISFEKESYMPETLYHIDSDTDQIGIYQETIRWHSRMKMNTIVIYLFTMR